MEQQQRLDTLCALQILDTSTDERFDRITHIAAKLFQVPIALVSMLDNERQWFRSRYDLDTSESPDAMAFCIHALRNNGPLVVSDTLQDPRFAKHPVVQGVPHVRFYAGHPVCSPEGHALGTLCIVDVRPRDPAEIDLDSLRHLAEMVEEEIRKSVIAARAMTRDEELNAALRHLSSHIYNSPLAVVQWDHAMRTVSWSDRAEELFGWSAERMLGVPLEQAGLVHPDDAPAMLDGMRQLLARRGLRNVSHGRSIHRDGRIVHCAWHNSILFAEDGAPISILSLIQDVTAQREAEFALRASEATLRTTFEMAPVGIAHVSLDGAWLRVNPRLCSILGYDADELQRMTFQQVTHPDDLPGNLSLLNEAIKGRRHAYSMEKRYLRKNGEMVWGAITVSVNRPPDGSPAYLITVIEDIHARKQAELALQLHQEELESRVQQRTRELQHSNAELALEVQQRLHAENVLRASEQKLQALARMDALTGLPNRRHFNEKLEEAIRRARRTGQLVGLMFLDVDHFKRINDTLGHAGGDAVLQEFARRLAGAVRGTDSVCRLAGDEFTIILENLAAATEARLVAGKILEAMRRPFDVEGVLLAVSTSIGIACMGPDGGQAQELTKRADEALYKAKELGRNQAWLGNDGQKTEAYPAASMRRASA
ncbi:diguanylate cyclase [Noviherbaspirillum sp. L7-7A]|uniref:diguanylate cyclase domain-containing protein n=1 Tax=Noviherbaspirillum sp. L7-7A TaxID=2850560 RepID=UPI001C2BD3F9|nr:diguanylate cyclase [Noviherbaspirillum sp. L7-7A]MBV0881247.1 diguanylate cyclase [Noviherbaspirillum sp. L7-7A]